MQKYQLIIGTIISGIIVMFSFYIFIKEILKRLRIKKRFKRAKQGELDAEKFLKSKGYKILASQFQITNSFKVDNIVKDVKIKPDFYVKKGFKKYYAEVKTGKSAIRIENRSTRRQILEYSYVCRFKPVLLIDMENKKIIEVSFNKKALYKTKLIVIILLCFFIAIFLYVLDIRGLL